MRRGGDRMMTDDNLGGNDSVEYLVGCTWTAVPSSSSSSSSPALHLLAGNSDGDGYLFRVDADLITPLVHLKGGHRGCIRDFGWIDGGGGGRRLVTGGEDARLCEWDLSENDHADVVGGGASGGRARSARGTVGNDFGGRKGKKKFGSPY